jgi:hypothetical protein
MAGVLEKPFQLSALSSRSSQQPTSPTQSTRIVKRKIDESIGRGKGRPPKNAKKK